MSKNKVLRKHRMPGALVMRIVFGLFFGFVSYLLVKMLWTDPGAPKLLLLAVLSFMFLSTLFFLFLRWEIVFDGDRQVVLTCWGLIVPLRSKRYPFGEFTDVIVTSEERKVKSYTFLIYPVRLYGPANELLIHRYLNYNKARRMAEQVAKVMMLPIRDRSSGVESIRSPASLDLPLRSRLRREEHTRMPPQPAGARCRIAQSPDQVEIEIPRTGVDYRHWIRLAFFIAASAAAVAYVVYANGIRWSEIVQSPSIAGIMLTASLALILTTGARHLELLWAYTRITAGKSGVQIFRRHALFSSTKRLKWDDIEEIEVQLPGTKHNGGIVLRGDRGTATASGILMWGEAEWLRAVLLHVAMR